MYLVLALLGCAVGMAVTIAAFYIAWLVAHERKRQQGEGESVIASSESVSGLQRGNPLAAASRVLLRWTVLDTGIFALFAIGALFLLTDVIGIAKVRDLYPPFHFGYLLCGFIFTVMAMAIVAARLLSLLQLVRLDRSSAPHQYGKPEEGQQTDQGV